MEEKTAILTCPQCEIRLIEAANAMRRHGSQMTAAIEWARTDPSEEQKQEIKASVVASFKDAQAAWDVYPEHLRGHGILPSL